MVSVGEFALGGAAIVFVIVIVVLAMAVACSGYITKAIGLFRMAQKMNYSKAWLAWIPIAQDWLLFNMTQTEYRVLAFNKPMDRKLAFWIYIALNYAAEAILSILNVIPYIGQLLSSIGAIAMEAGGVFLLYPAFSTLYDVFIPETGKRKGFTIASIVASCVNAPLVTGILLIIASKGEPMEVISGDGDSYIVND